MSAHSVESIKQQSARLRGTLLESLANPVTVTLMRKSGTTHTETSHVFGVDGGVLNPSTGKFTYKMTVNEKGRWEYRWKGTGGIIAADEGEFEGTPSAFTTP